MSTGKLYIVSTPIGNLGDFSNRAKETISNVDFLAAEDTRVTKKLLNATGLPNKPMLSYFEHNRRQRGEEIIKKILNGQNCALLTDAGTPVVSDPGEDLIALCAQNNITVHAIPGCCAAVCALSVSGLPTGRWCFEGFLSTNKKSRQKHLNSLSNETRTMIFYEAPHKLCQTLSDMIKTFGENRKISICRELTKLHEQIIRTTLKNAKEYYNENSPKGEYVLVIEGKKETEPEQTNQTEKLEKALFQIKKLTENGETLKDAVKIISENTKIKKNILYNMALENLQ